MSHAGETETTRIEAFSDGVFAIAITLLILDVKVPHPPPGAEGGHPVEWSNAALGAALWVAGMWKSYIAYLLSFSVILVMWVNHHRIFTIVRRTDQPFLFWNGLLLMLISVVPFPTALLSEYFATPAARTAAAVYSGHGFLIALAFRGVWQHATRNKHLLVPGSEAEVKRLTDQYRYGPLMYLVSFGCAFVSAYVSIGLCLLFAAFFSFMGFTGLDRRR